MNPSPPPEPPAEWRGAVRLCLAGCALGAAVALWLAAESGSALSNMFYVLFRRYEPVFLTLAAGLIGLLSYVVTRPSAADRLFRRLAALSPVLLIAATALAVLGVGWAGHDLVHERFHLSMDEYGADFQARIFLRGQVFGPVPEQWKALAAALTPPFINHHPDDGTWVSRYLPVYSALRAPFLAAGLGGLVNPLLSALSVVGVALVARRIWPGRHAPPVVAALLLAGSSQFLVTSMTAYAMPAHLCFNIWWLWLYLRGGWGMAAAGVLGVAALGLHQPVMHTVFVAPFLLRLVLDRRWGWAAYMTVAYAGGLAAWSAWLRMTRPELDGELLQKVFGLPDGLHLVHQAMNVGLLISWQPLVVLFALVGLHRLRSEPRVVTDLALSCGLTLAFYVFYLRPQGHGWGDRYFHPALGNAALLAALGWTHLREAAGRLPALRTLGFGLAACWLVLLPARCWEVGRTVRPFAEASRRLERLDAPVAVIDPHRFWYGQDLVRNGPEPGATTLILREDRLSPEQLEKLRRRPDVYFVTPGDFPDIALPYRPEVQP